MHGSLCAGPSGWATRLADSYEPSDKDRYGVHLAIQLCDEVVKRAEAAGLDWRSVTWPLWLALTGLHGKDGLKLSDVKDAVKLSYHYIDHPEVAPEWLYVSGPEHLQ